MPKNGRVPSIEDLNREVGTRYPLRPRQYQFVLAYAKHNNGMKAIREAGYNHSTPGSQSSAAHRLLKQERIQRAIGIVKSR